MLLTITASWSHNIRSLLGKGQHFWPQPMRGTRGVTANTWEGEGLGDSGKRPTSPCPRTCKVPGPSRRPRPAQTHRPHGLQLHTSNPPEATPARSPGEPAAILGRPARVARRRPSWGVTSSGTPEQTAVRAALGGEGTGLRGACAVSAARPHPLPTPAQ